LKIGSMTDLLDDRNNDHAGESSTNTANYLPPNDDVVNESDSFYDALLVGPAPSVGVGNAGNVDDGEESKTFVQRYLGQIITALLSLGIALIVFVILPMYAVQAAKSSRWDHTLYYICGVFVLIAVPISVHGIVQHLVNVSLFGIGFSSLHPNCGIHIQSLIFNVFFLS